MILIIDTNKRRADSISDIFYYMGILSRSVTPKEAFAEISPLYRAVIISDPSAFPDIRDFKDKLSAYSNAPFYSLSDIPDEDVEKGLFRISFRENMYSSTIAVSIANDLKAQRLPVIGTYRLAGIDASCDVHATVLDSALPFTKTELMILRYLIAAYPVPQSAKKILKYAFKPGRSPDISGIRTHISVMNKKFRQLINKTLVISLPEKGYVVATPEILAEISAENAS